ncbi:MAG TPA: CsbD family protein [Bryobacteraceae bacterium]|nr:CsbD family protein [Bryobacteraceae bacterium]
MNWDTLEGNWKQMKGSVREQWGKLTDNDLEQIAGKKDQLLGRIQERYGISREIAQQQADQWLRSMEKHEHAGASRSANR